MKRVIKAIIPGGVELYYNYLKKREYNRVLNLPEAKYEEYLTEMYAKRTGCTMDFSNPLTMTQKQQWMKLYDLSNEKTRLSDKYAVRSFIKDTIGEQYLIPLVSINGKDQFFNANEIDFKQLPNSFVLKCNHGSGYNIIVRDKSALKRTDVWKIKRRLNNWMKENYDYKGGIELVYRDIKPCIMIEKYMAIDNDLPDYKFMCFHGDPKFVWCDQGRYVNHKRTVYDLSYSIAPFNMHTYEKCDNNTKPENFDEMLLIARTLCKSFIYVRVDLYDIEGKIYFGEMTFSSASGCELPTPLEWDKKLGDLMQLDLQKRHN